MRALLDTVQVTPRHDGGTTVVHGPRPNHARHRRSAGRDRRLLMGPPSGTLGRVDGERLERTYPMGKISFVAGLAAGYVLGARAGKERYAQIKRGAGRVWTSQPVERKKADLKIAARTKAGPYVADRIADAAKAAGQALRESGTTTPKHLKAVPSSAEERPRTGTDD